MYILRTVSEKLPFYFPLSVADSRMMPITPSHAHDCIEIAIILSGTGVHESMGRTHSVSEGDVLVIYPYQLHAFPETSKLHVCNILFQPEKLNMPMFDLEKIVGFQELFAETKGETPRNFLCFQVPLKDFKHTKQIVNLMREEQNNMGQSGYRSAMLGLFMALLCDLLRAYSSNMELDIKCSFEPNIEKAVQYINNNYLKAFRLTELLKIATMSRSSFMTYFRKITGYAPKQYVLRKRVEHAIKKLAETDASLTEIAFTSGFHDSSHFSKVFKQVTGEVPRKYRKRVQARSILEKEFPEDKVKNPFLKEIW